MEVKNSFNVLEEGDKISVNQLIRKIMTTDEAYREFTKMDGELTQLKTQEKQMVEMLEKKKLEADLAMVQDNIVKVEELKVSWGSLVKPKIDEITKKIKHKIREEKIKRGYKRELDTMQKVTMINNIIGPLAEEFDIDMNSPIIGELKKDFDNI